MTGAGPSARRARTGVVSRRLRTDKSTTLWVAPEHRGNGKGRLLVDHVRTWAREHALAPLIVHCSPRNRDGRAFYEALGMRAVSVVYQDDLAE
ncbi:GNAT family N-acetyltransferase [Streptomyces sp. NBC_00006]|uniref:GNAT family N-acetyltransferase n=1 Tax=Streptomyces sp. NBC_00006 TaxID=2975619 RepID=UPI00338FBA8C